MAYFMSYGMAGFIGWVNVNKHLKKMMNRCHIPLASSAKIYDTIDRLDMLIYKCKMHLISLFDLNCYLQLL